MDRRLAADPMPPVWARRYVLDLERGRVGAEQLSDAVFELPRIDYRRRNGRPYRYSWGIGGEGGRAWSDRIVKLDVERGETSTWAQDGCYPGEPVFVPDPGRDVEDAGALLSVV